MMRITRLGHCLALLLALFSFAPLVNAKPVIMPSPPQLAAEAYVLMDATTGEILIENNADLALPPASLTKMMTSYIVTEEIAKGELTENTPVLISDDAWERGGAKTEGSTMFLNPRTKVPVIDLLRGVIIQSGNDASIALAQHIAGGESPFAEVMNQYAQILGMQNTHFKNATGWPSEGHVSTARDLAILARAVINHHPEFYPIYSEKYFSYNGVNQPNRNRLLFRDPSVDGLKTGHTRAAGYCLVASAKKQDMRLISVVLKAASSESRAVESQKLLAYGFRYYQTHPLYSAGDELSEQRIWKGIEKTVSLGLAENAVITIPKGAGEDLKAEIVVDTQIEAPVVKGQKLGELVVTLEEQTVFKGDLIALDDVARSGFFSRSKDGVELFFKGLFE